MATDTYVWRARVQPAAIVVTPAIAFGIVLGARLEGISDLWGIVSFALIPLAAAIARHAGNRVQEKLWTRWGGAPASRRLWLTGATNPAEVQRRRTDVTTVLGGSITFPTAADEQDNSDNAESEYRSIVRRLIAVLRAEPTDLMDKENANYGFARNLYGLKPYGITVALITVALSVGIPTLGPDGAAWDGAWWISAGVGVIALVCWPLITPGFVRPAADAWADRLFEAVQVLAGSPTRK